jgi:hypothetical protein
MLEKTRVVLDYPHEKNFHIFYYIMAGLDKTLMGKLHLTEIQNHRYLNFSPENKQNYILFLARITRYNEIPSSLQLREWLNSFELLQQTMLKFGFSNEVKIFFKIFIN